MLTKVEHDKKSTLLSIDPKGNWKKMVYEQLPRTSTNFIRYLLSSTNIRYLEGNHLVFSSPSLIPHSSQITLLTTISKIYTQSSHFKVIIYI